MSLLLIQCSDHEVQRKRWWCLGKNAKEIMEIESWSIQVFAHIFGIMLTQLQALSQEWIYEQIMTSISQS